MAERAIDIQPDSWHRSASATALAVAGAIAGPTVAVWAIGHVEMLAVGDALRTVGWTGLWAMSAFHLIETTAMGLAWWRLRRTGKPARFVWARLVRDAGSEALLLSPIGGSMLGVRAVTLQGTAAITAGATLLVDMIIEFAAQVAYVVLGLTLLAWQRQQSLLVDPLLGVAGAFAVAVGAAVLARRHGLPRWLARAPWLSWPAHAARLVEFKDEIAAIYRGRGTVWPSFLLHLGAWLVSGVEAWLALRLMGVSFSLTTVLMVESQVYAVRSVAFAIPGAIGVQEAAYLVVGAMLGLPADLVLGLSLLKRARDITLGIPALLSWQVVETRRRWRFPARDRDRDLMRRAGR